MCEPLLIGAFAYTPNVATIWEGMRDYFGDIETPIDFVLFSNYGRQVDALLDGFIDIAWNTNLAWVRTVLQTDGECPAVAMGDTDTVFQTVIVARAGSRIEGLAGVRGRRLALGSRDSAQAAILPIHYLRVAGMAKGEVELVRIDSRGGRDGDTGGGGDDDLLTVSDT